MKMTKQKDPMFTADWQKFFVGCLGSVWVTAFSSWLGVPDALIIAGACTAGLLGFAAIISAIG